MEGDVVIRAEGLGKRYRIGSGRAAYGTLRDALAERLRPGARAARSRQTLWALRDVAFEVRRGEVLGVIGRNGAGKSTLFKVLSRITPPTEGRVELRGRVGSLLEVGTGFHPELTGRENVYFNGAVLGMTRREIRARFDEIVAFAAVERFLDTPVKRYSSGMYLRLAFAVAAHLETEVLLVDEVLAVGDVAFQRKCLGKMGQASRGGRTVLMVSHNMAAVRGLCGRCLLIDGGRVVHSDTPDGAIRRYMEAIVAPPSGGDRAVVANEEWGIQLLGLDLVDSAGRAVPALQVGQPAGFRLRVRSRKRVADVAVSMGIHSLATDARVAVFHSGYSGAALEFDAPGTDVTCLIPRVPFAPGAYTVVLKVLAGRSTVFLLRSFITFDVIAGDFFGTGKLPDPEWGGLCYVDSEWRAEQPPPVPPGEEA